MKKTNACGCESPQLPGHRAGGCCLSLMHFHWVKDVPGNVTQLSALTSGILPRLEGAALPFLLVVETTRQWNKMSRVQTGRSSKTAIDEDLTMSNGPQVKNLQHRSGEFITEMPQNVNPVSRLEDASIPGWTCPVLVGFHGGRRRSVKCCKRMLLQGTLNPHIWMQTHNSVDLPVVQARKQHIHHNMTASVFPWLILVTFPCPKQTWWGKKGEIVKLTTQSASLQNMPSFTETHETQNPKRHTANKSQRVSSEKTFTKL